jgi:hypothetical protein
MFINPKKYIMYKYIKFQFYQCTGEGPLILNFILDRKDGSELLEQEYKGGIVARGYEKMIIIGYNEKEITNVHTPTFYLNSGNALNGNYYADQFDNFKISIYLKTSDSFNNLFDINEKLTGEELAKSSNILISLAGVNLPFELKRVTNSYFSLIFEMKNIGEYKINNPKFPQLNYFAKVVPGYISRVYSFCKVTNELTNGTIATSMRVNFECFLYDQFKNPITDQNYISISNTYTISYGKGQSSLQNFDNMKITGNSFLCSLTTTIAGTYKLSSAYAYSCAGCKFKEWQEFPYLMNVFNVVETPTSLDRVQYYSYEKKAFIEDQSVPLYHTNYLKGGTPITFFNLSDSRGNYASVLGYGSSFKLSDFSGSIIYPHDPSINPINELIFDYYMFEGKTYISVTFSTSNSKIEMNSYEFLMTIKYRISEIKIKYLYPSTKPNLNMASCLHPISYLFTSYTSERHFSDTTFVNNSINKIGKITLRTTDKLFYNKKVDITKFTGEVNPNHSSTKVIFEEDPNIEGIYFVYIRGTKAAEYTLILKLYDTRFYGDYRFKISPVLDIATVKNSYVNKVLSTTNNIYNLEDDTCDTIQTQRSYGFEVYDKWDNLLINSLDVSNSFMNLRLKIFRDNQVIVSSIDSNLIQIRYENPQRIYEKFVLPGKYEINFITRNSDIKFRFYRKPGKPSRITSFASINANVIKLGEFAEVSLRIMDSFNNLISYDRDYFRTEINRFFVYAVHETSRSTKEIKTQLKLKLDETIYQNLDTVLFSAPITDLSGRYRITIDYVDAVNTKTAFTCTNCSLEVKYSTFDLNKCKLYLVTSNYDEMFQTSTTNINNSVDVPLFNFFFYDTDGIKMDKVDTNINLKAFITGKNNFKLDLTKEWEKSHHIYWMTIEKNVTEEMKLKNLKADDYLFNISLNDEIKLKYPLRLLGDGNDSDSGNGAAEYANTFFNESKVKIQAGISYNISIIFRTKENLRVNFFEDISLFSFKNNANLLDPVFKVSAQQGPKKGTYIISFTCQKQYDINPLILSIYHKEIKLPVDVQILVKHSELSNLIILPECIQKENTLKDGKVAENYEIKVQAYDKYGNVVYDIYNDSTAISQTTISNFFTTKHEKNEPVKLSIELDLLNRNYINLKILGTKIGNVNINSHFFLKYSNGYNFYLNIGDFCPVCSFGTVTPSSIIAGNEFTYVLSLIDKNDNHFDNTVFDFEKNNISNYYSFDGENKQPILWKKSEKKNEIFTVFKATKANIKGYYDFFSLFNNEKKVSCRDCNVIVKADIYKFENSILYYLIEEQQISYTNDKFDITKTNLPRFKLIFYDQFNNNINNNLNIAFQISLIQKDGKIALELCYENQTGYVNIYICKNEKSLKDWKFLLNGDYKLSIQNVVADADKNYANKTYNISIKDGNQDDNASNAEVDYSKTAFAKLLVDTIAGEFNSFTVEIRTVDNKRKYVWEDKPEEYIIITQDKIEPKITYNVSYGEVPGIYLIKVMSLKAISLLDNFFLNVKVGSLLFSNKIRMTTTHNIANSLNFLNNKGEKIDILPKGNADEVYKINLKIYDKYLNLVNPNTVNMYLTVTPPSDKIGNQIRISSLITSDSIQTYEINSIYKGIYEIKTNISNEINFEITYGLPSDSFSLAIADKQVTAGNISKLYIIPYDKNNNLIDAINMPTTERFRAILNWPSGNKDLGKATKIEQKLFDSYSINNNKAVSAFLIEEQLKFRGDNLFSVFYENKEIKCLNCLTTVTSNIKTLDNFYITYFDTESSSFKELLNNTNFDNVKSDAIIRIFPRDIYGNKIDIISNFSDYTLTFKEKNNLQIIYKFKISNIDDGNEEFIEFKINDNSEVNKDLTFSTLTKGEYIVTVSEKNLNKKINVNLFGREGDNDAGNEEIEITKTVISSSNLEFVAGTTGFIILELRTITNKRKNNWFYKVDIKPENTDESFSKNIKNASKLGQYLITFGSNKANTFPKPYDYKLKLFINDKEINSLNVLIKIQPGKMEKSYIMEKYLSNKNLNTLITGNCDNDLSFEIQARDGYDNIAEIKPNDINLRVISPNQNLANVFYSSDNFNLETLNFTVNTNIAGRYSIKGNMMFNYFYDTIPGKLDSEKSFVENLTKEISAGEKAKISLEPRDKNFNLINPIELKDTFKVSCKDPLDKDIIGEKTLAENSKVFIFEAILTNKGKNTWNILINNKTKECKDCVTNVKSSFPVANKSDIYLYDHINQSNILVKNKDKIQAINTKAIILLVTAKDQYNNIIENTSDILTVNDGYLYGNGMEKIQLDSNHFNDIGQKIITIPNNSMDIYNKLVASDKYQLSFKLTEVNSEKKTVEEFSFQVNMFSEKDSEGYGNGDYVIENTYLSKTEINMYADNTDTFIIRLKTKDNLFYFGNIDPINDIKYLLSVNDKTFTFKVEADIYKYNYYTITVYSKESSKQSKILTISLIDKQTKLFRNIPGKVSLMINPKMPPYPPNTKIIKRPTDDFLSPNKLITITFNLFDEYGNIYHNNYEVLNRMTIINNNFDVSKDKDSQFNKQLLNDGFTYEFNFIPDYPPKNVAFYIEYSDQKLKIIQNVLNQIIQKQIVSEPDFSKTQVFGENINTMYAGESIDLNIKLMDYKNICEDIEGDVEITANIRGPIDNINNNKNIRTISYSFEKKISQDKTSICTNSFKALVTKEKIYTESGDYEIIIFIGKNKFRLEPIIHKLLPGEIEFKNCLSILDENTPNVRKLIAGTEVKFTIEARDKFNNKIISDNKFTLKLIDLKENNLKEKDFGLKFIDEKYGQMKGYLNVYKSGLFKMEYYYSNKLVEINTSRGIDEFEVIPNICSKFIPKEGEKTTYKDVDDSNLLNTLVGKQTKLIISCYDIYRNKVITGGENFSIKIQVSENENKTNVPLNIKDNLNGNYIVEFVPPLQGDYNIVIILRENEYYSTKEIIYNNNCKGDKPLSCSNKEKCVNDLKECIDDNKCQIETPIYCEVDGKPKCTKSTKECDCPKNVKNPKDPYVKCFQGDVCVLSSKKESMCFDPWDIDCQRFSEFRILNKDGICRSKEESPARRVCPLGFYLCTDLTCRKNIEDCEIYRDCANDEIRCADMTCVKDQKDCPSRITCPKENQVVCPDGECVDNDIYCKTLPTCNEGAKFLCSGNVCSSDKYSCPKFISCGHGRALCKDMVCRYSCRD